MSDKPKRPRGFQKGNTYGQGRPKVDPELKKAKKLTKTRAQELFTIYMNKTVSELEKVCKDKQTTVLEGMIARVALKAITEGDQKRLDFMLDRTIGKVKEITEIQLPRPMIVENLEGEAKMVGAIEAEVLEDE